MKRIVSFTACVLMSVIAFSQSKVVAVISNVRNDKGVCHACIFNNPASFKGESGSPFQCLAVPVKNLVAEAVFTNVPPGTYALFVFHDANTNQKLDKNFMGMPKEGYGASKNKLPFASAPAYNDNKFVVDGKTMVRLPIKLRNLY